MKRHLFAVALSLATASAFALPVTDQDLAAQAKPTAAITITHSVSIVQGVTSLRLVTTA